MRGCSGSVVAVLWGCEPKSRILCSSSVLASLLNDASRFLVVLVMASKSGEMVPVSKARKVGIGLLDGVIGWDV